MPDNWGFVAAAYLLAALVFGGYLRRLARIERDRRVQMVHRLVDVAESPMNFRRQAMALDVPRAHPEDGVELDQRGRELLVKPDLDRAAIEAFRAEQMGLADAFSRRIAQALGDVAEILTPEQRRKIADLLPPRQGFWRRWHRG